MQKIFIVLIRGYRFLSHYLLPARCRFFPSCSRYAEEAIAVHGVIKGGGLTLFRLMRCHPGSAGGVDEVPKKTVKKENT